MLEGATVPIIVVGYRNAADVAGCLGALARLPPAPSVAILICENGGPEAYDALLAALTQKGGPCSDDATEAGHDSRLFRRARRLRLNNSAAPVFVAEAVENLGYAGGINAWLESLMPVAGWEGAWILNPDTAPWPSALEELVSCCSARKKGMVGSRIMFGDGLEFVDSRGLRWMKWRASTRGVDIGAPAAIVPDPSDIEARIDSPTGVSFYVTRSCIERIGFMDERFFLYFEELDWGLRARDVCGVGYADRSVVPHVGGTTIGSSRARASRSRLAVYLDFRNRLIFVGKHYPYWYPWTLLMCAARASEFLVAGSVQNFWAALRGLWAGLRGETGRPNRFSQLAAD